MFERSVKLAAALGCLATASAPSAGQAGTSASRAADLGSLTQPERITAKEQKIEVPLTFDRAIDESGALIVRLNAKPLPYREFNSASTAAIQRILDRWGQYRVSLDAAAQEGKPPEERALAQSVFVSWIKSELEAQKIEIPSVSSALARENPALFEQVRIVGWGLPALLAVRGAAMFEFESQRVVELKDQFGTLQFEVGNPIRVFKAAQAPEVWKEAFKEPLSKGVPLIPIILLGGAPYAMNADGNFMGAGSFAKNDAALIDLHASSLLVGNYQRGLEGCIATVDALHGRTLEETVRVLKQRGKGIVPDVDDPIDGLKNGRIALRRLYWSLGTESGREAFNADRILGEQVTEFVHHEAQHVLDRRCDPKRSEVERGIHATEEVRQGGIKASLADRIVAETIAETEVRLKSFRHSSIYFLRLIAESRSDFANSDDICGHGARGAQKQIFEAVLEEIAANPGAFGVKYSKDPIVIEGETFTPREQLMAQIDVAVATVERRSLLIDAVEKRIGLPEKRKALADKYFPSESK